MVELIALRHGPTVWNAGKRLQGRQDIPLSPDGEQTVASWELPERFREFDWHISPLTRAQQTASILGLTGTTEEAIIEMNYGEFEGRSLVQLREEYGEPMIQNEAKGLDFLPPGGESPRMVQERILPWLKERAAAGKDTGIVVHKGLLRALYALATGWDMKQKEKQKMRDGCCHLYRLREDGMPELVQLNIAMVQEGA